MLSFVLFKITDFKQFTNFYGTFFISRTYNKTTSGSLKVTRSVFLTPKKGLIYLTSEIRNVFTIP